MFSDQSVALSEDWPILETARATILFVEPLLIILDSFLSSATPIHSAVFYSLLMNALIKSQTAELFFNSNLLTANSKLRKQC